MIIVLSSDSTVFSTVGKFGIVVVRDQEVSVIHPTWCNANIRPVCEFVKGRIE